MVNTWWTHFVKTWWKPGENMVNALWKPGEHIVKPEHFCQYNNILSQCLHLKLFSLGSARARARLFVLQNKLESRARADPTEKSFHFFLRGHSPNKTSLVNTRWKPDGIQKASFLCNKHGGTKLGELWKLGEKLVGFGHYDKLGEDQGETKVKIKGTLETKSTL